MILFEKEYDSGSIADIFDDLQYSIEVPDVEYDEHGFFEGTYKITVEFKE